MKGKAADLKRDMRLTCRAAPRGSYTYFSDLFAQDLCCWGGEAHFGLGAAVSGITMFRRGNINDYLIYDKISITCRLISH
jgi:hypothetical protein